MARIRFSNHCAQNYHRSSDSHGAQDRQRWLGAVVDLTAMLRSTGRIAKSRESSPGRSCLSTLDVARITA